MPQIFRFSSRSASRWMRGETTFLSVLWFPMFNGSLSQIFSMSAEGRVGRKSCGENSVRQTVLFQGFLMEVFLPSIDQYTSQEYNNSEEFLLSNLEPSILTQTSPNSEM